MEPGTQVISILGWPPHPLEGWTKAAGPASPKTVSLFPECDEYKDLIESVLEEKVLDKGAGREEETGYMAWVRRKLCGKVCQGEAPGGRIKRNRRAEMYTQAQS